MLCLDEESQFMKSHIAYLLRSGRDDRRATLDDILISFERLRLSIHEDMCDAAVKVKAILDLGNDHAFWLFNSANAHQISGTCQKNKLDPWTESDNTQESKVGNGEGREGSGEGSAEPVQLRPSLFRMFGQKDARQENDGQDLLGPESSEIYDTEEEIHGRPSTTKSVPGCLLNI